MTVGGVGAVAGNLVCQRRMTERVGRFCCDGVLIGQQRQVPNRWGAVDVRQQIRAGRIGPMACSWKDRRKWVRDGAIPDGRRLPICHGVGPPRRRVMR